MPIYEYSCDDCGSKFEKLIRRASDELEVTCPSCGEKHLTQQLSTFAAHANGSPSRQEPMSGCPGGGCQNAGSCPMRMN